ncbi:MAG: MarR family transcriptional regulator [Gemmatimonadales bacterium]|nr:MAG: MarR family transcriptional regulator [Gemmatimonadales bacterium]
MHKDSERFIERMGLQFETDGLPRTAGRIMGLLLLREAPLSLDDISGELGVSKGSSSTNCRLLESGGWAERVSRRGDRRDFYQVAPDMALRSLDAAQTRIKSLLALLDDALESLPAELETGRRRIRAVGDFHRFLVSELQDIMERWARIESAPAESGSDLGEGSHD